MSDEKQKASKAQIEEVLCALAARQPWVEADRLKVKYMRPGKMRKVDYAIQRQGVNFTLVWNIGLKEPRFRLMWSIVTKELRQQMNAGPSLVIGMLKGKMPPRTMCI